MSCLCEPSQNIGRHLVAVDQFEQLNHVSLSIGATRAQSQQRCREVLVRLLSSAYKTRIIRYSQIYGFDIKLETVVIVRLPSNPYHYTSCLRIITAKNFCASEPSSMAALVKYLLWSRLREIPSANVFRSHSYI